MGGDRGDRRGSRSSTRASGGCPVTWRPRCQRCFEVIDPGEPRRRLCGTTLATAKRAGLVWLRRGGWLHADCCAEVEEIAKPLSVDHPLVVQGMAVVEKVRARLAAKDAAAETPS